MAVVAMVIQNNIANEVKDSDAIRSNPIQSTTNSAGGAENDGHENDGPSKCPGMKLSDMKMQDMFQVSE